MSQDPAIQDAIHNESCLDTMARLPDGIIDLVVTSPPYDNIRDYDGKSDFQFAETAKELYRIIKPGGIVVWIVGDQTKNFNESGTSFRQAIYFQDLGFLLNDTMIYHKRARSGKYPRYYQAFEYMFVLSKGLPKTINLIADKRNKTHRRVITSKSCMRNRDKLESRRVNFKVAPFRVRENIWYYENGADRVNDKIKYEHPAIFPDDLATDHIKSWSNENDLVYDPFAGSGTTLKMAQKLKRHWLGSEINPRYCEMIQKRMHLDHAKMEHYT